MTGHDGRRIVVNAAELRGNASLKQQLAAMAEPPHMCVLSGSEGSGRHTLARILAQALVCQEMRPIRRPCGVCPDCQKVIQGIHPDVIPIQRFLTPESKEIKVDAARQLRQDAYVRPNEGRCKVYLLDCPINGNAQNALLKLLEDGPTYAAFLILTDQPASLLETVRSRCVHFRLTPPKEETRTETRWGDALLNALCANSELALVECVAGMLAEKVTREQLEESYQVLSQQLVDGLTQNDPRLSSIPRAKWIALTKLAEEARKQCAFNLSVGHSAGWFAAKSWQILMGGGA